MGVVIINCTLQTNSNGIEAYIVMMQSRTTQHQKQKYKDGYISLGLCTTTIPYSELFLRYFEEALLFKNKFPHPVDS